MGDAGIELEPLCGRLSRRRNPERKPRDLWLKRPIRRLRFAQLLRAGSSASAISASHPCSTSKWCRMLESNQRLAVIDRGLDLRANPAWCAVRELNPHLLGVGQLFSSVELPAQNSGRGCRSRTCLAALIWRRSGYKPLLLPEAPPLVARDGFEPSTTAL